MKAGEGKLGRVFFLRLEEGDSAESLRRFVAEKGIRAGQALVLGGSTAAAVIVPDADGEPGLRFPEGAAIDWNGGEIVVQEFLEFTFQRVRDPSSGRETLERVPPARTRVLTKPSPAPEEAGPGTVPVYLFNAEFN